MTGRSPVAGHVVQYVAARNTQTGNGRAGRPPAAETSAAGTTRACGEPAPARDKEAA